LIHRAVGMALGGDPAMLELCIGRILAPRRNRPTGFALPPMKSAADLAAAMTAIGEAVGDGVISPGEAVELAHYIESFSRVIEAGEFAARLERLEAVNGNAG